MRTPSLAVLPLAGSEPKLLNLGGSHPRYVPTGHVVYGVDNTLRAVRFDLGRLEVTSDPIQVVDGVPTKPSGAANFSVAQNQSLVYVRGEQLVAGVVSLVWVDRDGNEEPLAVQPGTYDGLRISPDGTRVALMVAGDLGGLDIHIYDFARNNLGLSGFPNAETLNLTMSYVDVGLIGHRVQTRKGPV